MDLFLLNYKKKNPILFSIIIVLLSFISDSLFIKENSSSFIYSFFYIVILIISILLLFYLFFTIKFLTKNFILLLILIPLFYLISFFLNSLRFDYMSFGALYKIILFLFGLSISFLIKLDNFINIFIKLLFFISLFSLVFFCISFFFWDYSEGFFKTFPIIQRQNYLSFYSLVFTNIPISSYERIRNWGLFSEPGEYQIYLNIGLILLLFFKNNIKHKFFYSIIFSFTIISTFSTTGYLLLFLVAVLYTFKNLKEGKNQIITFLYIFLLIILFFFILNNAFVYRLVFDKLIEGFNNKSFSDRVNSIFFNLRIIFNYPMFGVGPYQHDLLRSESPLLSASTNIILHNFSIYGLIPGLFFIYLIVYFLESNIKNKLFRFNLLLFFLVLLSVQEMNNSILISTLFFLSNNKRKLGVYL